MTGRGRVCVVIGTALVLGLPGPGAAQQVSFRPQAGGLAGADAALKRVLKRDRFRVIDRDTVLGPETMIEGDLIVVRATVRLEGVIRGDLVAVQSDVFARPGSRIDGRVIVLNGGFYGSALADVRAPPIDASYLRYTARRTTDGRYLITGPKGMGGLRLPGAYGFGLPTYERVDAVTVEWGLRYRPEGGSSLPAVSGRARYHTVREQPDGELEAVWTRSGWSGSLAGGRTVRTNDDWIAGDLVNSLTSLVSAVDTRNYYDAGFIEGALGLQRGARLVWRHELRVSWERARSLRRRDVFSVFEDRQGFQPNLPIDEGDIVSVRLESGLEAFVGEPLGVGVHIALEGASDRVGDFGFSLLSGSLKARIPGPGESFVSLRARGQGPLGPEAPRQRWRALGGWGTLPTAMRLARLGDRMWWVDARYLVPTPIALGYLGRLTPWVAYAAGNAWSGDGAHPSTINNLGIGVTFGYVELGLYTDPGADFDGALLLGVGAAPGAVYGGGIF